MIRGRRVIGAGHAGWLGVLGSVTHRRLRRRQPRDRHAMGRTTHVIDADFVEELDAGRIAAVPSAHADRHARSRFPAEFACDLNQTTDARTVHGLERVVRHVNDGEIMYHQGGSSAEMRRLKIVPPVAFNQE